MRFIVVPELCISCGLCTTLAPEVFEMCPEGYARAIPGAPEEARATASDAAECCPVGAIREE